MSVGPFVSTLLVVCVGVLSNATAIGQEWTRFRGPNGSGISDATTIPVEWTEKDYNWKIDLPGVGNASPVVWGDRVFVTASDEKQRSLVCIDAKSGKTLWTHAIALQSYKKHKNNSYASSTPCVDERHVYVLWHGRQASPLIALNHAGKVQWQYDLGGYTHGQGGAASPIVADDVVIVAHDQKQPSFLVALDRVSGKVRWKAPREGKRACYSTPCIRGSEVVFTHCYEGVSGFALADGKPLWHADVFGRSSQRALGSPILAGDFVIATSGAAAGVRQLVAVRPGEKGVEAKEAWRAEKQTPHVPTPLAYKDWLFLWSDQGIVSCLNQTTGESLWRQRVGGSFFGSPVCVDGKLYCVDLDGKVNVIAASADYKLFGKVDLGEGSKATPAVSGGVMYLRTDSKLFALGK